MPIQVAEVDSTLMGRNGYGEKEAIVATLELCLTRFHMVEDQVFLGVSVLRLTPFREVCAAIAWVEERNHWQSRHALPYFST